jgi:hypothetical protein
MEDLAQRSRRAGKGGYELDNGNSVYCEVMLSQSHA